MPAYTYKKQKKTKRSSLRKALLVFLGLIILICLGVVTLKLTSRTKPSEINQPTNSAANSESKGESASGHTSTSIPAKQAPSGNKDSTSQTSSTTTLSAPSGNFVSNHHPNLSGSPAPSQLQSVCNTTVGAMCQVIFTKNSVTKSLPAQVADKSGATYWTWTLQGIGLTSGSWQITAKATLGSQTLISTDPMSLEVAQ